MTNKAPNVRGPGNSNFTFQAELPDCVKLETQKDQDEFNAFITKIIEAAQKFALGQVQ